MRYQHTFEVRAPAREVAEFHRRATSLAAITPPPIIVRLHRAPERLADGDVMEFTLWVGPLPLRWTACIEQVTAQGFVDRQVNGPFARWAHRHTFIPNGMEKTHVIDEIEYRLSAHPFWFLVGLGMGAGMPLLFLYRGWKTKRMLEGGKK
jgi:ligand-binding SRPBCC domain-containing protein